MKKLLNFGLVALVATGLLFSCGEDEKQDDPAPEVTQPAKIDGSWDLISFQSKRYSMGGNLVDSTGYTYAKGYYVETYSPPSAITVTTDGKTSTGLYEIKQDSLIKPFMKNAGVGNYRLKIDSLTTTRLVLNITLKNAINGKSVWMFKYSR